MGEWARGGRFQGKEAVLRFWCQMTAFAPVGGGEVAGARAVKWLGGIAVTAGVILSQKESNIGRVVQEIGGTL